MNQPDSKPESGGATIDDLHAAWRIRLMLKYAVKSFVPTMTFKEVQIWLRYKSRKSVYDWLRGQGIQSKGRRYDRSAVLRAISK